MHVSLASVAPPFSHLNVAMRSRPSIVFSLLSLVTPIVTATCYYRSGLEATTYVQCPGVNFCCEETQFCESNGLCRDKNNRADGSVTYFPGDADPGPYNYTGLYQTPTCNNAAFQGCDEECTASNVTGFAYVWTCADNLETYCCHNNAVNLTQSDCCSGTRFSLPSPKALVSSSISSASISSTSSSPHAASVSSQPRSGLVEVVKIAMGVGITLAVLFVTFVIFLVVKQIKIKKRQERRRREQNSTPEEEPPPPPYQQESSQADNERRAESGNSQWHQLEGQSKPTEVAVSSRPGLD